MAVRALMDHRESTGRRCDWNQKSKPPGQGGGDQSDQYEHPGDKHGRYVARHGCSPKEAGAGAMIV